MSRARVLGSVSSRFWWKIVSQARLSVAARPSHSAENSMRTI